MDRLEREWKKKNKKANKREIKKRATPHGGEFIPPL